MSTTHSATALALAILIASIGSSAAQDIANIPAAAGAFVNRNVESSHQQSFSRGVPAQDTSSDSLGLFENSWDFANPNSIPGFGTLPPGYDPRPVLPRFSGE